MGGWKTPKCETNVKIIVKTMSNANRLGTRKGQERKLQSNYHRVGVSVLVFMGCGSWMDQGDIQDRKQ